MNSYADRFTSARAWQIVCLFLAALLIASIAHSCVRTRRLRERYAADLDTAIGLCEATDAKFAGMITNKPPVIIMLCFSNKDAAIASGVIRRKK